MIELKIGLRLKSAVCSTEVIIIKRPALAGVLTCGDKPMQALPASASSEAQLLQPQPGAALIGKRYSDASSGLQVLCTKQGLGRLAFDGRTLETERPKALPSSD
jgi:hypothetical protein